MHDDRITRLRRMARLASRSSDLSLQQELDRIARDEGHPHWGALLRAEDGPSRKIGQDHGSVAAMPRTWASDVLDAATGARTTRIDGIMVRVVGRPVCALVGTGLVPTAAAAAFLAALAATIMFRCGGAAGQTFADVILTPPLVVAALALHRISWFSPDSALLRIVRRLVVGSLVASFLASTVLLTPAAFGALHHMPRELLLAPIVTILFWSIPLVPMLLGTHAGRRRRLG